MDEKNNKKKDIYEELNYTPSKNSSNINISEEDIINANIDNDPEYKEYLRLKEKFASYEKQQKSNPILRIILKTFAAIFLIIIILFTIGYIMGKNGYKPQQFDWEVVTNQLNNNNTDEFSELEKVEQSGETS